MSSKQVQLRRGTASEHGSFTGAAGELTYVSDDKTLRIHDGATAGGVKVITEGTGTTAVSGDLNLVAGALQYAGVAAMCIRQIVTSSATGSDLTDITSTSNFKVAGHRATITPKIATSKLLIIGFAEMRAVCDDSSATYADGLCQLYASASQAATGSTANGTAIGQSQHWRDQLNEDTDERTSYVSNPIATLYAPGATTQIDIDICFKNGANNDSVKLYQNRTEFHVIEIG